MIRGQVPRAAAALGALLVAASVVLIGLRYGAQAAGGSDSYGYVSEARLFAEGRLRVPEPLMTDESWWFGHHMLAPLGWVRAPDRQSIVPTYSPGYPIVMAAFERLWGPDAVHLVVPLLGGLAVLATYALGVRYAGAGVGLAAAVLLATSPVFLFQLMFPMSDVPAVAWWTVSLVFAGRAGLPSAAASGGAAALAILTRPNLVPLAAVVGVVVATQGWRTRATPRWWSRAALFVAIVATACVWLAWLNTQWYGSPLRSGYGPLADLYAWSHLGTNLRQFGGWITESQTPAILLAIAAPLGSWQARRGALSPSGVVVAASVVAVVTFSYLFYRPFDAWWYLRFLLPAYPALFVLVGAGIVALSSWLPGKTPALTASAVVALLAWHGVHYSREHAVFTRREAERKYAAVGEYVSRKLPGNAALVAMQHSGSVRYYAGRLTIRYDRVGRDHLDALIADLRRRGYHPYFVLESWEVPEFRAYFDGPSRLASLDWAPVAELVHDARVRLYDPLHAEPGGETSLPRTEYFY